MPENAGEPLLAQKNPRGHKPVVMRSGLSKALCGARHKACFEGYWSHAKGAAARIWDYAPLDATLHGIGDRLQAVQRRNFYHLTAEASHRGRYYHEYTMSIDVT
eukprot:gene15197-20566_t